MLDLTQSEAGLLPLATEEVELLPFVTQVVREREEAIEEKGLTLDLRGDKGAGTVQADTRQLGRAIGNMLDNAITRDARAAGASWSRCRGASRARGSSSRTTARG